MFIVKIQMLPKNVYTFQEMLSMYNVYTFFGTLCTYIYMYVYIFVHIYIHRECQKNVYSFYIDNIS